MNTVHLREANVVTGLMTLESSRLAPTLRANPGVISITPSSDAERHHVAVFIEERYRISYGAAIHVEYPNLISLRDGRGRVVAAAGFRFADLGPLFLEQYTKRPIDALLGVHRREIVEIGNLAAYGGASLVLFAALASYLERIGIARAVVTSTDTLERRLVRLGLEAERVCAADPARIGDMGKVWGSYYRHRPHVLAGDIGAACDRLREMFGAGFFQHRPRLFPRWHFAGEDA